MQRPLTSITSSQQQSKLYDTSSASFRIKENRKMRQMPTQMPYDKEELYEDNLRLKKELQQIKFELKKERQEHANFEKVVTKTNETQKDFQIIISQRTKIKEQSKQIKELESHLLEMKQNPERTQRLELEAELEELKDAYNKLRLFIASKFQQEESENIMINKSLKEQIEVNLLTAYKQDNLSLSQQILSQQDENHKLQNNLFNIKNEKDRLQTKIKELEKQFESINKHNQYMRQEMQNQKKQIPAEDQSKKIDDLQQQISNYNKTITNLKKQIEDYEYKYNELQRTFDIYKSAETKEKEKLQDRVAMLKKQIDELNQKRVEQDSIIGSMQSIGLKQTNTIYMSPREIASSPLRLQVTSFKKTCATVNSYDIKNIVTNLKIELLSNNIPFDEQEIALCKKDEEEITLEEISQRLQKSPFNLSEQNSNLLARYLIEDNTEDRVLYDNQNTQTTIIIKSVYKKLIGEYDLFDEDEKQKMTDFFCNIFHKYNQGMESAIKQFNIKKKYLQPNECEYEDFNEALKYCDIILNNRQRLFLELEIYLESKQLQTVQYITLFKKFKLSDLDNSINN